MCPVVHLLICYNNIMSLFRYRLMKSASSALALHITARSLGTSNLHRIKRWYPWELLTGLSFSSVPPWWTLQATGQHVINGVQYMLKTCFSKLPRHMLAPTTENVCITFGRRLYTVWKERVWKFPNPVKVFMANFRMFNLFTPQTKHRSNALMYSKC